MPLRHPRPLNEKEWRWLMERLKKGPTEEQKEMMRRAVENGRKIRVHS